MNLFKFFVLLVFLAFLAGCGHHAKLPPCDAPNRLSDPGCYYAMKITAVKGDYAVGVIPQAVINDNEEQQKKQGKQVDFSNYKTEQHQYRIGVEGADKLEPGKIYWFRSRYNPTFDKPLERDTDEKGNPLPGMDDGQFKEELAKRQRQGHEKY